MAEVREVDADTADKGGMIALLPADPDAFVVDDPEAETAEDMHVTLAFFGSDVTAWDDDRRNAVVQAAQDAASALDGPLGAFVTGHATFNPTGGPDGDRDPCAVYLIGDCPELEPLRLDVNQRCADVLGDEMHAQHSPALFHVTAGYGLTADDLDYCGPVVLDRLLVKLAGQSTVIPLDSDADETHRRLSVEEIARRRKLTGTLVAIHRLRRRTHQRVKALLAPAVAAFAATAPTHLIVKAVDPDAPRTLRRSQAGLIIATALAHSPAADQWTDAITAAHGLATTAGVRAAAHHYSDGAVTLRARIPDGLDTPWDFDPTAPLDQQIDGLAGDIADLYAPGADVTDDDIAGALDAGDGALAYGDAQASADFLDGSLSLYSAMGSGLVDWNTMGGACSTCLAIEAQNPWDVASVPTDVHPSCRCFITAAGSL